MDIFEFIPSHLFCIMCNDEIACIMKAISLHDSTGEWSVIPDSYSIAKAAFSKYRKMISDKENARKSLSEKRAAAGRKGGLARCSNKANSSKTSKSSKNEICLGLLENEVNDNKLQEQFASENEKANQPRAHVIKSQDNNSLNNITIPKEQKKEKESDDSSQKENPESTLIPFAPEEEKKAVRIDTAMVRNLWNSIVVSLRPVRDIKDQRLVHLQARVREEGWTTEELPVKLKELFQKVQDSEFLSGRNGKWTRCKFDWVIESRPWNNILEGMYDNTTNSDPVVQNRNYQQQGSGSRITEKILNDGEYRQPDGTDTGARIELRQFEFEEDGRTIPYHPRPFKVIKIKTSSSH